jgi:L-rhamnose mutarotase
VSERIGFVMRLLPGQEAEYRARHEAVWPELLTDLKTAGAQNYSIFLRGEDLFAYLEVDDFDAFTRQMAGSEANARWQSEMASLIDPLTDPATGFHTRVPEIFHLE